MFAKKLSNFFTGLYLITKYGAKTVAQGLIDPLTNTFSRYLFKKLAQKELARAERYKIPFSLVFIDIDNLKEINDKHGHSKGDKLIKETAQMLRKSSRKPDTVFRYGGDEFIMLLPHTGKAGVRQVEDRLEKELEKSSFAKFSFGTSTWEKGRTLDELVNIADQRMFKSKKLKKK